MRFRADKLTQLQLKTGVVTLDEAGFLVDPDTWTPAFAEYIAAAEGIELGQSHWEILEFMRESWADTESPSMHATFSICLKPSITSTKPLPRQFCSTCSLTVT